VDVPAGTGPVGRQNGVTEGDETVRALAARNHPPWVLAAGGTWHVKRGRSRHGGVLFSDSWKTADGS
jgi:hypothetical protein